MYKETRLKAIERGERRTDMWKLTMGIYATLGIGWFLLVTEMLSRTSETRLMEASIGLVACLAGMGGSLIRRRRFGWSFLWAAVFSQVTFVAIILFFETIWRSL